jgi:hypothetical protein
VSSDSIGGGDLIARITAGVSSLVAVVFCSFLALGAPPSEFVQEMSIWHRLLPMMFPALFCGIVLALVGLVLSLFAICAACVACVSACIITTMGVTIAWGNDAQSGLRELVMSLALLTIPIVGAAAACRHVRGKAIGGMGFRRPQG